MFGNTKAFSSFAVPDLRAARAFYGETPTSLFHTSEERDGMLIAGMEQGMNESYAALDRLLASELHGGRALPAEPGEHTGP